MSDEAILQVSENVRECPVSAENRDVLSERQLAAIELILARQEPVHRRRGEVWGIATERLRALVHPARDVLEEQVHDEYDRSRVRAAGMILRFADLRKSVPPHQDGI